MYIYIYIYIYIFKHRNFSGETSHYCQLEVSRLETCITCKPEVNNVIIVLVPAKPQRERIPVDTGLI